MAVSNKANATAVFDLKSAELSVLALLLKTTDLRLLQQALTERLGQGGGLFENEPLCIDLTPLAPASDESLDLGALLALLRGQGFNPVALRGGGPALQAAGLAAGLVQAPEAPRGVEVTVPAPAPATTTEAAAEPPAVAVRTLIVDKPLRSGQQVYARGGDLVVLALVSFGAEVIADGHIHVYAPLRGRALAGARGDTSARIFAASMEPQLVSIAGIWRTLEADLAPDIAGKPAQIRLEGDSLLFEPLKF
jgi:septum site-determining protein MinC